MALAMRHNRPVALREYAVEQTKDSIAWLRDYITAIKSGRFHPFTALERKAREATRNEAWGPTGTLLNELADASFDAAGCDIIFAVIEFRLGYPNMKWRNVYKALTVLEFLIKRGSDQCVENSKMLMSKLEDLQVFEYTSPDGRDHGVNVRHRAQAIALLLKDSVRLEQERAAFASKRQVYKGFSREQLSNGIVQRTHSADSMEGYPSGTSSYNRQQAHKEQPAGPRYDSGYGTSSNSGSAAIRNAGEMKGVTMEENKQQLAALKRLLDLPHNKQCADCMGGGGAARASWASINTGVFICMRCAGIHRGLGVHVSKVRSCTLDTWLPQQVSFMAATGNAVANGYWEAKLSSNQKPHYESSDLEPFIRRKYCNKEFAEGTWPPALPDEATASGSAPKGVARQAPGVSASPATPGGAAPQLASDPSAGKLEAGGFWGSLTPQESSTPADLLLDTTPSASLTPSRPPQQRQSPQLRSLNADSPALLIDLMDFGAESTFQLPTTPRRQSTPAGSAFGSTSSNGVAGAAASGAISSNRGIGQSSGNATRPADAAEQASSAAAPAAADGLRKQQSSFPLLPPPPQVTRQLGPVQQPKQDPPAAPTPALTTQHTSPSRDMAMNTDMDMGGLEELVMNPDVMSNPSADPFSASHASYLQPHTTDASVPDQRHGYPQQQQRTWTRGAAPATGNAGSTTATAVQPQRQPSEPIFYNGQWFMPAPPGFTPPSGFSPPAQQQQSYNGVSQQVQGPHTPQALPQQHSRQQHLPQGAPHYQQHHEPQLQLQQQQQQQSFQQVPQQQQASNLHARTPQNPHMPSGQFAAASGQFSSAPGLTPANTASKDQVWSPTSAYQFESPTFRNGAAQQLSPGESGRTWSPVASDVTRLTLPQTEAAPSQQKDSIGVLDDLLQHALEGLQIKAQLDTGTLPKKAAMQPAMKGQAGREDCLT